MNLPGPWLPLLADEASGAFPPDFWQHLWGGFIGTLIFGLLGIALAALGFKVFDWMTPRIDIQRELGEKHNIAVAIVLGAVLLGVSYIIGVAVK